MSEPLYPIFPTNIPAKTFANDIIPMKPKTESEFEFIDVYAKASKLEITPNTEQQIEQMQKSELCQNHFHK